MSGFADLRDLGVTFRPFDGPPPPLGGRDSPFSAAWSRTIELLADELRHLQAKRVAIELALAETDLRQDGLPRASARMAHPAVRINFESRWGPLRYETGEYGDNTWRRVPGWQANVRAIALSMQALRAVDRYGVSKRGEQYRGWRQIAQTSMRVEDLIATREQAVEFMAQYGGDVKAALRKTHPDRGGDENEFRKVVRAGELLSA